MPMIICNFATNNKLNTIDIMNMTKKLMTMLLAMLALVSCDSKDEPYPEVKVESDIYVLVGSYDRDYLYNLDGETIYSSPEGSHIASLQAEGGDW